MTTEARLDRFERKLDKVEGTLAALDKAFTQFTTEQRVRDAERADERRQLLALIPSVRDLRKHIDTLTRRVDDVESTDDPVTSSARPLPSLPPGALHLVDEPTHPGSSMLPAYPDENPDFPRETTQETARETWEKQSRPAGMWDVGMRIVGVFEKLAKGFVAYQRMWGFIVLGIFGPPGMAVGLAQSWSIVTAEVEPAKEPTPAPASPELRNTPGPAGSEAN